MNQELPDVQAGLANTVKPEIKLPTFAGSWRKQGNFRKKKKKDVYFCLISYTKTFHYVDHNKLWKILKETGVPDHLTCLLRNLYAGQEEQLEPDVEQRTGSKFGKEYIVTLLI